MVSLNQRPAMSKNKADLELYAWHPENGERLLEEQSA